MSGLRLGFFKLNVARMEPAVEFWRAAFGFEVAMTFDEPAFLEHALCLPGQEQGPMVMLVAPRDGRDVSVGPGHGPVGLFCDNIEAAFQRAIGAGAIVVLPPFAAGDAQVAIVTSPQGHEIELVQIPDLPGTVRPSDR